MYSYKNIIKVAYPIFLGLLAQNVINVIDTAFLGRVGEVELGASALGGLLYICILTIAFGFSVGSQIIISRRNGECRYRDIGKIVIQGEILMFVLASFLYLLSIAFLPIIIKHLISSEAIYNATCQFLNWRLFGIFFFYTGVMFRAFYIGITKTAVITLNAVIMAVVNLILDYGMIFGQLGFPQWGLKGAAIASVIAEIVSLLFYVVFTFVKVDFIKYGFVHLRKVDLPLIAKVLSISSFTMFQYFLSMATWFVFFLVVERLGQRELAITNIIRSIYVVMLIPVQSLSVATNTLVSNLIGKEGVKNVMKLIGKISLTSFIFMVIQVLFVISIPRIILSVYTNEFVLVTESIPALYVVCIALLISSVASIYFNGISSTGDTKAALFLEIFTLAVYALYVLWIGSYDRSTVALCFTTEILYYILLLLTSLFYLKKGNWQNKKI